LTRALGQWRVRIFDRKFGADFLADVPPAPGVYRLYDAAGTLLYVGKAVNLRRRLAQYRTTRRTKSHRKRRELVRAADRISWQLCESELEASLTEIHLIQELSPRDNIAGAFPFLYPYVGNRADDGDTQFCLTTSPEVFPAFEFHGAFGRGGSRATCVLRADTPSALRGTPHVPSSTRSPGALLPCLHLSPASR
jgi:hypothetical protein